jgi:integrase
MIVRNSGSRHFVLHRSMSAWLQLQLTYGTLLAVALMQGYPLMLDLRTVAYADHLKPMVLLSLHTGMQYGELANLTWDDLHLDRAILTVHGFKAKSQKTRHIPLNSAARSTTCAVRGRRC